MTWWVWIVLVLVAALVGVATILWQQASRLDRLHKRILKTRNSFELRLVKRSAELVRTADLNGLDPSVAAKMRCEATNALALTEIPLVTDGLNPMLSTEVKCVEDRSLVESMVSRTIRESLTPSVRGELNRDVVSKTQLAVLDSASYRVELSRILHNQDVAQARALRSKTLVRLFRLAGHAPLPGFVDLDDQTK